MREVGCSSVSGGSKQQCSPFGGTLGKSEPSTSFILNTPLSKGVPTALGTAHQAERILRSMTNAPEYAAATRTLSQSLAPMKGGLSALQCSLILTWTVILGVHLMQSVFLDLHLHTATCSAGSSQWRVTEAPRYRFCRYEALTGRFAGLPVCLPQASAADLSAPWLLC